VIRLVVDQNFNEHILGGLVRREPALDWVHVRDIGLAASSDPMILEWAAAENRVLLTHDRRTIPGFAYARVNQGLPMPGVFLVDDAVPVGQAIEEIHLAVHCLAPEECRSLVKFFPL